MPPTRRRAAAIAQDSDSPRHRLLTTQEAATVAQVTPACIRQWTSRGYLVPTARQGRTNLYLEDHVLRTERIRRNRRSPARTPQPDQDTPLIPGRRSRQPSAGDLAHQARPSPALQLAGRQAPRPAALSRRAVPQRSDCWRWIKISRWVWHPARRRRQRTHTCGESRD
ncbi:MerR family transcriptional regulator [Streptomyces sp. ET3-23]|uniref:MerR family transcriptional regulator n=1 Tax=Streptomyces sp. ET3-23 TaxID=2885643 RepID=UPI001D10CDC0|nr:MerR family transcriptional regulator [Streptomyces sp. ET3-23]